MIFLQKWLLLAAFPWFLSASSEPSEPEADEPSPIADAPEGMRPEELRRLHRKLDRNGDGKVGMSWDECVGGDSKLAAVSFGTAQCRTLGMAQTVAHKTLANPNGARS